MIGRRDLARVVAGAALAWPVVARTQQPDMPVVGILGGQSPETMAPRMAAFFEGLTEAGYVEGRNVALAYGWADGDYARLPALAAELAVPPVDVIFAGGTGLAIAAAKAATTTIPIVFAAGSDPVAMGFVASLSRPGGNLTGVTFLSSALDPKRLELLHELLPSVTNIAALLNPANDTFGVQSAGLAAAAQALGVRLRILTASDEQELDAAFASLAHSGAGALLVGSASFFANDARAWIVALAARYGIPAIYDQRDYVLAGGLISYGTSGANAAFREAGRYVGRVLDGARPANLPVARISTFELVLNLRTAAALGITIPHEILVRATEVIE